MEGTDQEENSGPVAAGWECAFGSEGPDAVSQNAGEP